MKDSEDSDIFLIEARRCMRCGGLLTSKQAVRDGYGCICKKKAYYEKYGEPQLKGQMSLFDEMLASGGKKQWQKN